MLGGLLFFLANPQNIDKNELNNSEMESELKLTPKTTIDIIKFVEDESEQILKDLSEKERFYGLGDEQSKGILKSRNDASDYLKDYFRSSDIEDLSQSLFYTQKALTELEIYPYLNCLEGIENLSEDFKNSLYYLSSSDKEKISDMLNFKDYSEYLLHNNLDNEGEINKTLRQLDDLYRFEDKTVGDEYDCFKFQKYLSKEHRSQNAYWFLKTLLCLLLLGLGIFLGWTMRVFKNRSEGMNIFSERLVNIFNPKKVKDETIERVIKTNSILAIFGTIGALFISNKLLILNIFGYIALVDVLLLLSAIVMGIYALNNDSEYGKILSYKLFNFGILGFVILSAYLIFMIIIGALGSGLWGSAMQYLQNQTVSS
jgi:hypothetical protein